MSYEKSVTGISLANHLKIPQQRCLIRKYDAAYIMYIEIEAENIYHQTRMYVQCSKANRQFNNCKVSSRVCPIPDDNIRGSNVTTSSIYLFTLDLRLLVTVTAREVYY